MYTISLRQFLQLVGTGRTESKGKKVQPRREKVLRPDQVLTWRRQEHSRRLATCPGCDAVVNSEILHPRSGLCPLCHAERSGNMG